LAKLKPLIAFGGSPRASINLALAAKANAFLNRRGYVVPEDVRNICKDVLRHRIGLTYEAEAEGVNAEMVIEAVLKEVVVP
jgi:MoxR-like ATPase